MIVPPQEWNHLWAALFPSETIHGYWPLLGNWLPETMSVVDSSSKMLLARPQVSRSAEPENKDEVSRANSNEDNAQKLVQT